MDLWSRAAAAARTPGRTRSRSPRPASGLDLSDADLWLSFEDDAVGYDGATEFPDALAVGSPAGSSPPTAARVEMVPGADGAGGAVAFPAKCTTARGCARAMVEILPGRGAQSR